MCKTMKIFRSLQKAMSVLRNQPSKPDQHESDSFNWKSLIAFIFILKYAILTIAALLFEANTFNDYAECFYPILTGLAVLSDFSVFIMKFEKTSRLIHNFEITIQKRECQRSIMSYFQKKSNEKLTNSINE